MKPNDKSKKTIINAINKKNEENEREKKTIIIRKKKNGWYKSRKCDEVKRKH